MAVKVPELQKLGVQVLAMSTDSHFSHRIWQEEELPKMVDGGVSHLMLSDQTGEIGKMFGV